MLWFRHGQGVERISCRINVWRYGGWGYQLTFGAIIDNSGAVYRADSVNTVNNEKRLNGSLASTREEIGQNSWLGVGYIHGDINTSGGIKSLKAYIVRISGSF